MRNKRCCIIYNKPGEDALPDELDVLVQVEYVTENLKLLGIESYSRGISAAFMDEIATVAEEKPGFVFNLVESINNKGELNYFIPAMLNMHSIPYSGNPLEAMFLTTSKTLMGDILNKEGIRTPLSFPPSRHEMLEEGKTYIIKPVWEDGSLGITGESVFTVDKETAGRISVYDDSHWIIQEYIDGREFNISVIAGPDGPQVMPPAEIVFRNNWGDRPHIVDFKAKWDEQSFEYVNTVREFPGDRLDRTLAGEINEIVLRCWHLFGLRGYARVDMRIDNLNRPFVIEVNANPCLSPDSGLVAATTEAGLSFKDVLERIINDLNY